MRVRRVKQNPRCHRNSEPPPRIRTRKSSGGMPVNPNSCEFGDKNSSRHCRSGLTMLEVILAVGIFVMSMSALSQLIATGTSAAVQSRLLTQAVMRGEAKIAEVVSGFEPVEDVSDGKFENDDENWSWSMQVLDGPHIDLLELVVTVSYNGESDNSSVSTTLSRYVRDPAVFMEFDDLSGDME